MHRRLQEKAQDEETELGETCSCNFRLSTNPKEECRIILLGGDDIAKNDACRYILRNAQTQQVQRINLGGCEMKENYVQGRHVCVVNSPFHWVDRLASSVFFFSRSVKAIQNEMRNCVSLVYPGPHAFLLVIRVSTGKEHSVLKAIASVFGKEAIDYSMVVFIAGSEMNSRLPQNANLKSLLMCEDRYHLLENTDESVEELFQKVEEMISNKKSKFFIPSAYEKFTKVNFESWEKERINLLAEYKDEKDQLSKELKDVRKKLENTSQLQESTLRYLQDASQQRERELLLKFDASQKRENDLMMELNASQKRESELRMELETSQQREREQMMHLDASQLRESNLRKALDAFQHRETEIRKEGRWREVESYRQEPQGTGTHLVRRESRKRVNPNFSADPAEYLETVEIQRTEREIHVDETQQTKSNKKREEKHKSLD